MWYRYSLAMPPVTWDHSTPAYEGGVRCFWKIDLYETAKVKRYFIAEPVFFSPSPDRRRRFRCTRSWPCAPAHRLVSGESECALSPQSLRPERALRRGSSPHSAISKAIKPPLLALGEFSNCDVTVAGKPSNLHDFVLFLGNTGLRPDEAKNLQHRDVTIVTDDAMGEKIFEIEVRGKRGVGYCKSMPGAVRPYERLLKRALPGPAQGKRARRRRGEDVSEPPAQVALKYPEPTDPVFPGNHISMFNNLLTRSKLKLDRDGHPRTAYSLRHTYICMRLMEGADIYQIAKNCRTSVEMIERFYAAPRARSTRRPSIRSSRKQSRSRSVRRSTRHAPPHNAHRIALGSRPELPTVFKRDVQRLASAPLAGSANRGSPPIPVPKGTFPAWWV